MPYVDFNAVVSEIRSRRATKTMLTFHSVGDTDAISSALALSRAFPNSAVCTPDKLTANAVRILAKLGFDAKDIRQEFIDDAETVVLVDVNNLEGCGHFHGALDKFEGKIIVVDHHRPVEDKANMLIFSNESYNSAASISYDILKELRISVDKRLAKLIALGILSDSAELKNTMPKTFEQLGELFGIAETDYITLITEMGHISPPEERIKTVIDITNSEIFVKGGLLFMQGLSHAYANLASDASIKIGADIALFHTIGREISFSARMRPTLDKKYGIHLGKTMKQLSSLINGTGGGHPCAAGAYGSNIEGTEEFIKRFIETITESTGK